MLRKSVVTTASSRVHQAKIGVFGWAKGLRMLGEFAPVREHGELFYPVFGLNASAESQKMLDCAAREGRQGCFTGRCVDQIHP